MLSKDEGTPDMREISDAIREGADGFFAVQYALIAKLAVALALGASVYSHWSPYDRVRAVNADP